MKGVTFLKDEKNNKRILQIDVREIAKNPAKFEDLMDVIIAETRKDEKKTSWDVAKKQVKKAGKL
jgi:ribosomal protein S17